MAMVWNVCDVAVGAAKAVMAEVMGRAMTLLVRGCDGRDVGRELRQSTGHGEGGDGDGDGDRDSGGDGDGDRDGGGGSDRGGGRGRSRGDNRGSSFFHKLKGRQ